MTKTQTDATTDPKPAPTTMSADQFLQIFSKDERAKLRSSDAPEGRLMAHAIYTTWDALKRFEQANGEIERCRERIIRECEGLNCRRDSDCVSMVWIGSAASDMAKAIEQRNAAHREASKGLDLLHDIGMLPGPTIPDFSA